MPNSMLIHAIFFKTNSLIAIPGIEEEGVQRGFVLTDPKNPIKCQAKFEAQVAVLDLLAHKSVFTAGYTAVLHIHTAVEECTITVSPNHNHD